jgi:flagellar basal body-associated protein FliL
MASFPQQPAPRRSQPTQRGHLHHAPKPTNWVLWILLVIILVAGISVVAWRLNYQEKFQKADDKIMALLESADELIIANRDVEAEALVQQGIGLIPGDDRCQKVIDRIDAKRQMIHQRNAEVSNAILAQAEELTKTDIVMAIEAFNKIVADNLLTPEALTNAKARIASLKGVVCSLRIPENWPNEAVLTLDGAPQRIVSGFVKDIMPGKHEVKITRFGFSDPPPMELDFRSVDPVALPAIAWKVRGTKVFVKSTPPGAAVWLNGEDTQKVTPFEKDDMADGPVEVLLKHPDYADASLKGEIKDQQPLLLNATLESVGGASP